MGNPIPSGPPFYEPGTICGLCPPATTPKTVKLTITQGSPPYTTWTFTLNQYEINTCQWTGRGNWGEGNPVEIKLWRLETQVQLFIWVINLSYATIAYYTPLLYCVEGNGTIATSYTFTVESI
jgi:hypothetical protein